MNRLDRGMYTVPIWWGLLLTGVYVLTSPTQRLSHAVPHLAETIAAVLMFVSALACLTGSRIHDLALAYTLELVGLVGIVVVLGWLAVVGDYTPWQQFTLAGGLGALVQIGSIRMAARLALELYRHRHPWRFP